MWQTVSSSWIYGQSSIIIARVYRNRHSEALKDLYLSNGYVPHEGAPLSHHIIISTWVCFRSQVCFAIFAFILCIVIHIFLMSYIGSHLIGCMTANYNPVLTRTSLAGKCSPWRVAYVNDFVTILVVRKW